jgi:hypothetical protein
MAHKPGEFHEKLHHAQVKETEWHLSIMLVDESLLERLESAAMVCIHVIESGNKILLV